MRPDTGMVRATLVAAVALLSAVAAPSLAQSENALSNGGFEDGASGWLASTSNTTLTVDGTDPVHSGSAAGRLTATGAGAISAASQYWWAPIDALEQYTLSIHVQADDAGISNVAARLEVVDGDGRVLASREASPETGSGWLSITTESVLAPALAEYARVVVRAAAASAGAVLHIDSAVVNVVDPTPPPTETATATATSTATATATATTTPGPQPTPQATVQTEAPKATPDLTPTRVRSTPARRPEPTISPPPPPRPAPPLLLRDGDFEPPGGIDEWRTRGGVARVEESTPGSSVAVLTSRTTATKWIYQVVPVTEGEWYEAGAWLLPRDDAELGLVRIAWYASGDGSGRQLATVDSSPAPGDAADFVEVTTPAVQAPPTARSAQVRLMLRPRSSALATLVADDAYFEPAPAPTPEPPQSPPPTETPVASPTAIAAPASAATPGALDPPPTETPVAIPTAIAAPAPADTPEPPEPRPAETPVATPTAIAAPAPADTPEPPEPRPTETPVATPTAIATPSPAATSAPAAVASPAPSVPQATASPEPTADPARSSAQTPVASTTPQPTPLPTPRFVRGAAPAATPPPAHAAPATSATSTVLTAFDIPLRITALLPDPIEPGPDSRFEWIEVTNVGPSPLRIRGFELRDNASSLPLPDVELPAGGSILVAGEAADVGDVIAVRVDGGLFNGLANAGDRVVLLTTAGAVVDALSYGDDGSSFGPPLAAPGAGEQLRRRFAANGALVGVEVGSRGGDGTRVVAASVTPTPGAATRPVTASPTSTVEARRGTVAATSSPATASATEAAARPELTPAPTDLVENAAGGAVNRSAWIALASVALGALAGVGAFRLRELLAA